VTAQRRISVMRCRILKTKSVAESKLTFPTKKQRENPTRTTFIPAVMNSASPHNIFRKKVNEAVKQRNIKTGYSSGIVFATFSISQKGVDVPPHIPTFSTESLNHSFFSSSGLLMKKL